MRFNSPAPKASSFTLRNWAGLSEFHEGRRSVGRASATTVDTVLLRKYFAPEDAVLMLKFGQRGGRIGTTIHAEVTIHYKHDGKPAIVSPADVKAVLSGPARAVAQTRGAANKYKVFWETNTPGSYQVEVTVRGKCKASTTVHVSAATSPKNCRVEGLTVATVGQVYKCKTIVIDELGVPLPFAMGDTLSAELAAVQDSFRNLKSVDAGDGTFTTSLEILQKGKFEFHVKINGVPVGNSPFQFSA